MEEGRPKQEESCENSEKQTSSIEGLTNDANRLRVRESIHRSKSETARSKIFEHANSHFCYSCGYKAHILEIRFVAQVYITFKRVINKKIEKVSESSKELESTRICLLNGRWLFPGF